MAYLANDPKDEEKNETPGMNITQGAAGSSQDQGNQGATAPRQFGASASQAAAVTGSQKAPKASSGRFTGIKSYLQANQLGGQKMSGAIQKDTGAKASQIAQNAQAKQAQVQNVLNQNQAKLDTAKTFATGQIQDIMGPPPTPAPVAPVVDPTVQTPPVAPVAPVEPEIPLTPEEIEANRIAQNQADRLIYQEEQATALSAEEAAAAEAAQIKENEEKFQTIMAGDYGQEEVGPLTLGTQQQKAEALAALADATSSEGGRSDLLRQSFGRDRDYTRGQTALDAAILGGDAAAVEGLRSGIKGQASGVTDKLTEMRKGALSSLEQAKMNEESALEDVQNLIGSSQTSLKDMGQEEANKLLDDFGMEQMAFEKALKTGEGLTTEMLDKYVSPEMYNQLVSQAQAKKDKFLKYIRGSRKSSGRFGSLTDKDLGQDVFGLNRMDMLNMARGFERQKLGSKREFGQEYAEALRNINIDKSTIQNKLLAMAKQGNLGSFLTGPSASNISGRSAMTPEQVAKYNRIASLAGSDALGEVQAGPSERGKFRASDISGITSGLGGLSFADFLAQRKV